MVEAEALTEAQFDTNVCRIEMTRLCRSEKLLTADNARLREALVVAETAVFSTSQVTQPLY